MLCLACAPTCYPGHIPGPLSCLHAAKLSFPGSCGLKPVSAPSCSLHLQPGAWDGKCSSMTRVVVWVSLPCAAVDQLPHPPLQPLRLQSPVGPPSPWCSLPGWWKFLLSQLPPRDVGPLLIPYLLVPFVLLGYMGIFLTALVEWDLLEVFSGYSVRTVPHVDVFFTSPCYLLCHRDILLETINFWQKLFNFLKNSWDQ